MSKRIALWVAVLSCLATSAVLAAGVGTSSLNTLNSLFSKSENGAVVVGVTGVHPIMDYTYYDYDPETFVVDMADVDVSQIPKTLVVNKDGVRSVKVVAISTTRGRALAKLEIKKAYLAKCIVTSEGNKLEVTVVQAGKNPVKVTEPAVFHKQPSSSADKKARVGNAPGIAAKSSLRKANMLLGISVASNGSSVGIQANGSPRYKYFTMSHPNRIVVDLYGVNKGSVPNMVKGAGEIERVRVGILQAKPAITRVVLDMKRAVNPVIVSAAGSVVSVWLKKKSGDKPALAEVKSPAKNRQEESRLVAVPQPVAKPSPKVSSLHVAAHVAADKPGGSMNGTRKSGLENVKVDLTPLSPNRSKEFKGYKDLFVAQNSSLKSAKGKTLVAGGVPLSFQEKTISGAGTKYTGEPISLSLKDADIRDVLRMFHDISKMNIVVNPAVRGKVTVDLTNVPWDQAMDIILKNNGLDYIYENNVIWVAPAAEIASRFAQQQRIRKQKLLAEVPVTFTKRLSYAKASKMQSIASKFISKQGDIIVDPRTNTLIIREVPSRKASLLKLINSLDTPAPQVLIEARIVETTVSWAQDFGISWGGNWNHNFKNNQTSWPSYSKGDFSVNVPAAASNGFIDLTLGNVAGSFLLDVQLAAMENQGRGRVLSAPRILTEDNQKASIESGRQIPIPIVTNDQMTVIFVNALLKLDVTPHISADGNINMTVDITNDSIDFANQQGNQPPPILKKEAKTVLKVMNGHTAVIGGIFINNEAIAENGLPFLAKIPVLGWLFKNRSKTRTNDELLIFLTPKIVR